VNATSVTATNLSGALAAANVQPGTFPNGTFTAQNVTVTGTLTAAITGDVAASAVTAGTFGAGNYVFPDGLTVDTNTLHVDHANNRVGVGTTSPATPFHVASGVVRLDNLVDISNNAAGAIKFPANPTASTNANTLDAYAETGWTVAKYLDVANTTVTDLGSYFIKVGRLVHVYAYFSVLSTNSSDSMIIEGLPASARGTGELRLYVVDGTSTIGADANAWARSFVLVQSDGRMISVIYNGLPTGVLWSNADSRTFVITGTYRANS
jgi:hypothetical protein